MWAPPVCCPDPRGPCWRQREVLRCVVGEVARSGRSMGTEAPYPRRCREDGVGAGLGSRPLSRCGVLMHTGPRPLREPGGWGQELPPHGALSACMSQVSLNKVGEYWWSAVLEGEEHIDIDKINKERSMATVDEEEHAVLDRLTFDYHQKLQGKPQSHELVRGRAGRGQWGTLSGGPGWPWPGPLSPSGTLPVIPALQGGGVWGVCAQTAPSP